MLWQRAEEQEINMAARRKHLRLPDYEALMGETADPEKN